jgi:hypothetical protein
MDSVQAVVGLVVSFEDLVRNLKRETRSPAADSVEMSLVLLAEDFALLVLVVVAHFRLYL